MSDETQGNQYGIRGSVECLMRRRAGFTHLMCLNKLVELLLQDEEYIGLSLSGYLFLAEEDIVITETF